jgi:hypothetical protein
MTFTNQGNVVSTTVKSAGTTLSATPSSTISVGDLLVAIMASDNVGTTDGDTTAVSFADDQSNAWTRLFETTRTGGSANDGVTVAAFVCIVTTQIGTSDNITMTTPSLTNRQFTVEHWTLSGTGISAPLGAATARGNGASPSVTSGSIASAEYLWIGALGVEGKNTDTFVQDTDYSNLAQNGNNAGSPTSNTAVRGGYRVFTGTQDTYNTGPNTSRDYATGIAAIQETGVGTPASDSQPAYLAGGAQTSDNQPAYLAGELQTSSSQSAYLNGALGAIDSQPAYLSGQDTAIDNQSAYLAGELDAGDSQVAYLAGQDTAQDNQSAYLAGVATATSSQSAYLEGGGGTPVSSSTAAFLRSPATTSIVEILDNSAHIVFRDAAQAHGKAIANMPDKKNVGTLFKFWFTDTANGGNFRVFLRASRDWADWQTPTTGYEVVIANNSGTATVYPITSGSRGAAIDTFAVDITVDVRWLRFEVIEDQVRVRIWDDGGAEPSVWDSETTDATISTDGVLQYGYFRIDSSHEIYLDDLIVYEYVTSSVPAYLSGQGLAVDNQPAYLAGGAQTSDNQSAYLAGQDFANSSQAAYLEGLGGVVSSQSAYLAGQDAAIDSTPAYLAGQLSIFDNQPAYLFGQGVASDNQPAYLAGQDTAQDNQLAYLAGGINVSDSQPAYLNGAGVAVSSSQSAYLAGQDFAVDSQFAYLAGSQEAISSQSAYLEGDVSAVSSQSAYLAGQDFATDSTPAYLSGGIEVASSVSAYLEGDISVTSSQAAYLVGQDFAIDNQPAYLFGEATLVDNQPAYLAGGLDISSSQPAYLNGILQSAVSNQAAYLAGSSDVGEVMFKGMYRGILKGMR